MLFGVNFFEGLLEWWSGDRANVVVQKWRKDLFFATRWGTH